MYMYIYANSVSEYVYMSVRESVCERYTCCIPGEYVYMSVRESVRERYILEYCITEEYVLYAEVSLDECVCLGGSVCVPVWGGARGW